MKKILTLIFAMFICAVSASAQVVTFFDEKGEPVRDVLISTLSGGYVGKSGIDGTFDFGNINDNDVFMTNLMGMESSNFFAGQTSVILVADVKEVESVTVIECSRDMNSNNTGVRVRNAAGNCVTSNCKPGYIETPTDTGGTLCQPTDECPRNMRPKGADEIRLVGHPNIRCEIVTCAAGFKKINDGCVKIGGDCAASALPAGASAGVRVFERGAEVCKATECVSVSQEVKNGQCVDIVGDCNPNVQNGSAGRLVPGDDGMICELTKCADDYRVENGECVYTLTPEQSRARIDELKKNADAMKDKERSLENRALGAASMAATGIGAGELLGGLAQQSADRSAENEMQAFVNTFSCDYGSGTRVEYGTVDEILPGADALYQMYNEYINTADALKIIKTDLGMMPGIESEIVFDRAATGLYDDVSAGRMGGGTFASVSRALLNGGADMDAWSAQTDAANDRVRTGAIAAGAGIIGGIVGNELINNPNAKGNNIFGKPVATEQSREINAKYDALRKKISDAAAPIMQEAKKEIAHAPMTETGKEPIPEIIKQQPPVVEPVIENPTSTVEREFMAIPADALFASGKTEIMSTDKLDKTIAIIKENIQGNIPYKIRVVGHTDTDRINPNSNLCRVRKICGNNELSLARANAVRDYINTNGINAPITTGGMGQDCATGNKQADRMVVFYIAFGDEEFGEDKCPTSLWELMD